MVFKAFLNKDILSPTKRQWIFGLVCLLGYFLLLPFGLSFLFIRVLKVDTTTALGDFLFQASYFVSGFLMIALCFWKFLLQSAKELKKFSVKEFFKIEGFGLLAYYVLTIYISRIMSFFRLFHENPNNEAIDSLLLNNPLPMIFFTVVLVPITEECLFRGTIFAPLCKRSQVAAYVVSAGLFSAMHVVGFIGQTPILDLVLSFVQYLPAGLVFGRAYQRTRSIWGSIILHSSINLIAVLLTLLLSLSGGV